MSEFEQAGATEQAPQESVAETVIETGQADESGASEHVAESDEQKAERLVKARQVREQRNQRRLQDRFNELTEQRRNAERQVEQLTGILQRTVAGPGQNQPQQDGPPRRDQYNTWEEWQDEKAAYIAERRADARFQSLLQNAHQQTQVQQHQNLGQQLEQHYGRNATEFAKATPDFADVVGNDDIEIPNESVALIKAMPEGARIAYAIGKNPAYAAHLMQFNGNPVMQALALGEIKAQLKSSPQISNAPRPGTPVGSRSGSSEKDVRRMTRDQYYDHINTRKKRG